MEPPICAIPKGRARGQSRKYGEPSARKGSSARAVRCRPMATMLQGAEVGRDAWVGAEADEGLAAARRYSSRRLYSVLRLTPSRPAAHFLTPPHCCSVAR